MIQGMDPVHGGDVRRRRFHGGHVLIEGELVRADVVVDGEVIAQVVTDVMDDDRGAQTDVDCRERVISAGFIDCSATVPTASTSPPNRTLSSTSLRHSHASGSPRSCRRSSPLPSPRGRPPSPR
jgi:hypothetical protein